MSNQLNNELEIQTTNRRLRDHWLLQFGKPALLQLIEAHAPFLDRLLGNHQTFQPISKLLQPKQISLKIMQVRHEVSGDCSEI